MARLHFVKKAQKDYPEANIKKGDSYWWWKHNFGRKQKSRTKPSRSRLTQSSFYSQLYDIQDAVETFTAEGIEGDLETMTSDLQNLLDECQESLDNMPEQLKETSDSGMLLSERVENLEEYINSLEAIDPSFEETDGSEKEMEERLVEIIEEIGTADPGL